MNAGVVIAALAVAGGMNLQSTLDQIRIEQEVPGVSAVVTRKGEVIFAGASGVADLETGRKMTPDTVLYAGSLTKILTAVLTLQLVEKGELSLDDVVPGIAIESSKQNVNIKVEHLLTHASGLKREGDFNYWFNADFPDEGALAKYLAATDLRSAPGDSVSYSNIGYAALGPVIARASGQSYDDALRDDVFKPLGMDSSGTLEPGNQLSAGYSPVNRVIPSEERPFAGLGRYVGSRRIREYHNAKAMTPAFGAYTSSYDLSRLARMLLGYGGDDILSADMRSRLLPTEAGVRELGIRLARYKGRPVARHGGWFAAHRTHLLLDLSSGIAVVVMANSDSASPDSIAEALLDHALGDASGNTDD
jgi:D-alanyl-D-alanine carboxypeptidase